MSSSFRYLSRLSDLIQPFQPHRSVLNKNIKPLPFELNEVVENNFSSENISFKTNPPLSMSLLPENPSDQIQFSRSYPHQSIESQNDLSTTTSFFEDPSKSDNFRSFENGEDFLGKKNFSTSTHRELKENDSRQKLLTETHQQSLQNRSLIYEEQSYSLEPEIISTHQSAEPLMEVPRNKNEMGRNQINRLKSEREKNHSDWNDHLFESKKNQVKEHEAQSPRFKNLLNQQQEENKNQNREKISGEEKQLIENHFNTLFQQKIVQPENREQRTEPHFLKIESHLKNNSSIWSGWSQFIGFGDKSL